MNFSFARWFKIFLPLGFALLFASQVQAFDLFGALGTELEVTDNARKSNQRERSDLIQTSYGEFEFEEDRKSFQASARFRLEHEDYYEGSYDDDTSLSSSLGLFNIEVVENLIDWKASFTRTDVLADRADDEDDPNAQEYRNIFRTGPALDYFIDRSTRFNASLSYVKLDNSEEQATDSERAESFVQLSHSINSLTSVNLSADYSEIIESDEDEEIDSQSLTLGLSRQIVDGSVNVSVGKQEINSNLTDTEDGVFSRFTFIREVGYGHTLNLSYSQSISDTSIGFADSEEGSQLDNDPVQINSTTDFETREKINIGVTRPASNFSYDVGFIYQESDFKIRDDSERYAALILGYSPKLVANLIPRIEYRYEREDFGSRRVLGKDVTNSLNVSASHRLTEDFIVRAFTEFETRSNDQLRAREYDVFSLGAGIRWEFD